MRLDLSRPTRPAIQFIWMAFMVGIIAWGHSGMAAPAGGGGEEARAKSSHATASADAPSPHSEAGRHREPLSLEEIEIQGDRLFPQAVYIVAGAGDDAMTQASVRDYLVTLEPLDHIGLLLILNEGDR
jgi:hypothetical protein